MSMSRDEERIDYKREREHFLSQELAERAKSQERRRISRELHDRVSHDLGVAHQSLELYEALKERDPNKAAEKISLARECIKRSMKSIRNLSNALSAYPETVIQ
jgi:signal transduction histidine kinase